MRRAVGAVAVALAAACSLPLPTGVHTVGAVQAEHAALEPLQVIPPGPKEGASPTETVLGFLGAQADSDGSHAIARRFLAPAFGGSWHDDLGVRVYDPDQLQVAEDPGATPDHAVVRVSYTDRGRLRIDGSYVVGTGVRTAEEYDLQRRSGAWLISVGPEGLLLTEADRARTFVARNVYFLAPRVAGSSPHLVADRVFLPAGADEATSLVTRLLAGPSRGLAGSVGSAVPAGARLLRPVATDGSGVVTVDVLSAAAPTGQALDDLKAQVVWTVTGLGSTVKGVRLDLSRPSQPGRRGAVLALDAFDGYDPDPLGSNPPYYYVSRGVLRVSTDDASERARDRGATEGLPFSVDAVAVTPDRSRAALLGKGSSGVVTVRVGSLGGTAFPVVTRSVGLSSPSWGSGELGLWLLRRHRDVVLIRGGTARPVAVPVTGLPAGGVESLAVSRDDARIALVTGGHLYVGRVEVHDGAPAVVGLVAVLPSLTAATRVAWESGTEVVVLGSLTRPAQVVRVSVDGSAVEVLNTGGLRPTDLAASPGTVVLVSGGVLYETASGTFRAVQTAVSAAPAFPG